MSILDSFYLIFEAETTAIGTADEKIKQFKDNALESLGEVATAFLGMFAASEIIKGMFENAEMVDQLGKTAKALDVNVSDLDAWGQAVKRAGGTSEGFQQSLKTLNANLQLMAARGGEKGRIAPFLKELGIDAYDANHKIKPVMDLLPELADSFSKLSHVQTTGIGQKLGLDAGTIQLLQQGRAAVEAHVEEMKALGVVTQENVDISTKFEDQWDDTQQMFRGASFVLEDIVLPVLTEFLRLVEVAFEYMSAHKNLAIGFFIGIAGAVTMFYLPAMIAASIATLTAIAPFLLIGAAILAVGAAFAIVYDDVKNFNEGNKSVLGELVKKWPELGVAIHDIGIVAKALWADFKVGSMIMINVLADLARYVNAFLLLLAQGIVEPEQAWINFTKNIKAAFTDLMKDLMPLVENFEKIWDKISGAVSKLTGAGVGKAVEGAASSAGGAVAGAAKSVWGDVTGALQDSISAGQQHLAVANSPIALAVPAGLAGAGAGAPVTNNVTIGPTTVNTAATDPKAVAKTVGDTLQAHITTAINHHTDGVAG